MRHHLYNPDFTFVKDPVEFNKNTQRELLQYCLGATLYMPGKKDFASALIQKKMPGLTSIVMCLEDAITADELPGSERTIVCFLDTIAKALNEHRLTINELPLFQIRVRSPKQFKKFTDKLTKNQLQMITGFVFPKFTTTNGHQYLNHLKSLNTDKDYTLYGLPILESHEIAYKETRTVELTGIRNLLKPYQDLILNVRVGATDFSSKFGVRRGIDYSIYDIMMVRDCLSDILNFLGREDEGYIISAPVWEYFLADQSMKFKETRESSVQGSLLRRNPIVNAATDGLLREVVLDKANGFVGKTVIHPSHIQYVNAMHAVTKEEYDDAVQILKSSGGVIKSAKENKMNEINPHRSWANKIAQKAKAYGVVENELSYMRLFSA